MTSHPIPARGETTPLTIHVLGYPPIDVNEVYAALGFDKLPPTPTMTGRQIKLATKDWDAMTELWVEGSTWGRNGREDRHVMDAEAVPLVDGMKFYRVVRGHF